MQSRVKLAGHPAHPMLIVFPWGFFHRAVFDIIYLVTARTPLDRGRLFVVGAGLIGGIVAAVPDG